MDIVIEGPDNSGKSTLANLIRNEFNTMEIVESEGKEKYAGEMNERTKRWLAKSGNTIFDRHPVISQKVYGRLNFGTAIDAQLVGQFYASKPLFIYCKVPPARGLAGHKIKEHDEPTYIETIRQDYANIVRLYDLWAFDEAHLIVRMDDDPQKIMKLIRGYMNANTLFDDIKDFHKKFKLAYDGKPRSLDDDLASFRIKFMEEELDEYINFFALAQQSIEEGKDPTEALEGMLDALVDLAYVGLGTAYLQGFNFDEAWRRVHKANMAKVRTERAEDSKRGSTYDVIKPEGWVAPSHKDLVENHAHKEVTHTSGFIE